MKKKFKLPHLLLLAALSCCLGIPSGYAGMGGHPFAKVLEKLRNEGKTNQKESVDEYAKKGQANQNANNQARSLGKKTNQYTQTPGKYTNPDTLPLLRAFE